MSLNIKNQVKIIVREDLNGKKYKILTLDCKKCSKYEKYFYKNKNCIICFSKNLFHNKNKKFDKISIGIDNTLIENDQFVLFLDYFKRLRKIKKISKRIENIRKKKCLYKNFQCKIFPSFISFFKINDNDYYDPILLYDLVTKRYSSVKDKGKNILDPNCQDCYNFIKNSVESLLKILNESKIIKRYIIFKTRANLVSSFSYYDFLFSKKYFLREKKKKLLDLNINENEKLIEIYKVGKYGLFQVSIFKILNEEEKTYKINLSYESEAEKAYFEKIIQYLMKNLEIIKLDQIISLEDLIKIYKKEAIKILNSKFEFSRLSKKKIGFYLSLKKINLEELFPLLIDDYIEEIFLDSPYDEIYINHQKFGRCRTKISFNFKKIERLKSLLRLYSGKRLDYMSPSLKLVIKNKFFYCRFAVDVDPIHLNNFALDIRKLNKSIFTIQDLLKNATLNTLMASYLFFILIRRFNITVTGETDTGKTTFINALDLLTPKEFRKIYIENIIESLNESDFGNHQLKYKVDSLENNLKENFSKSSQIKTLLHRSPDIIYLGEILTKEEAEAMFHCLAAGLRGFQTIHANNIDSLINRFLYHFKINSSCLNDLDLIILMKKDHNKRRIISISEIFNHGPKSNQFYNTIFQYDPALKEWNLLKSLYDTNIINKLKKYENLSEERFRSFISVYKDIFEFLLKVKKIDNLEFVSFFHKISYYSRISLNRLKDFLAKFKKQFLNGKIEV
ncbi:MAG: ATPase, T2SS/T4P/T4SS family [Promethearchaeota archaeon]